MIEETFECKKHGSFTTACEPCMVTRLALQLLDRQKPYSPLSQAEQRALSAYALKHLAPELTPRIKNDDWRGWRLAH